MRTRARSRSASRRSRATRGRPCRGACASGRWCVGARCADHRKLFPVGSELKVLVLPIEDGGRRIRLSREKALAQEEQAETQAYIKDAARKGGFGMTLGDFLKGR